MLTPSVFKMEQQVRRRYLKLEQWFAWVCLPVLVCKLELPEADIQTLLDILRDVAASSSSPLRGAIILH